MGLFSSGMQNFLKIIRALVTTPWFYLYWAISAVGFVAAHRNSGLHGSPLLGATAIASSVVCFYLFYWQLAKWRKLASPQGDPGAVGLILSLMAFRLRLLCIFSPLIVLFFWRGDFDKITKNYLHVALADPEEQFGQLVLYLRDIWLPATVLLILLILDEAGRSLVVGKGYSDRAVRSLPRILKTIWRPLTIFILAELGFMATGEYFSSLGKFWRPLGPELTPDLLFSCLTAPLEYLLHLGGLLFLAQFLWSHAPHLFRQRVQ